MISSHTFMHVSVHLRLGFLSVYNIPIHKKYTVHVYTLYIYIYIYIYIYVYIYIYIHILYIYIYIYTKKML